MSFLELLLYNIRHVQEHSAQLSLFLGQNAIDEASDWVPQAKAGEGVVFKQAQIEKED